MRALTAIPAAIATTAVAVLNPVAGQDRPTPSREFLIGTWSFDGTCASGWGMGLAPDGEVWFDEWGHGLWVLEGETIRMILQESEPGSERVLGVVALSLRVDAVSRKAFTGLFVGRGETVSATKCE